MEESKTDKNANIINGFYKIYRTSGLYKVLEIKVSPPLAKLYIEHSKNLSFDSNLLPMLTLPVPWTQPEIGGYLLSSSNLLRLNTEHNEQYDLIKNSHNSQMHPVYDSLNTLASCPWKINKTVSLDLFIVFCF